MQLEARHNRLLMLILLGGLILRLAYALDQPTLIQFAGGTGGDSAGYLVNGAGFFSGREHGWIRGLPFYVSNIKPAPLYIVFVGVFQVFLPDHEAIVAIRLVQCLASITTVYFGYRLATSIARNARAGLVAAALMAFHPAFITEPASIATETLYIFFVALGLWLYMEYVDGAADERRMNRISQSTTLALAASAFGLATLTRGVSALFPVVIALHLAYVGRRLSLARWRQRCLLLLVIYAAVVSTWTIYNLISWNRFVIVSDQMMGALWRGAERDDGSPAQNDQLLLEGVEVTRPADCEVDCKFEHATETYVNKIAEIVSEDPPGYLALRFSELAYAVLQPYGTAPLGDVSVMGAARAWISDDRSLAGLLHVLRIEGFAPKLAFWLFHYIAIGFGLMGMIWSRRRWLLGAPLAGFALYTIAIHFFLLALPRYLFPIEIVWLAFAGIAIAALYERWRRRRRMREERRRLKEGAR